MTTLNLADKIMRGGQQASRIYLGSTLVWQSGFKPTDIANCRIWIDATKIGLANGAAVHAWRNLGGAPQPVVLGSPSPTLQTNALNTQPVVRFTGTQGRLRFKATGIDKDYTLVYVARKWTLRLGRVIAAGIDTGTSHPNILFGFWNNRFDCAYVEGWLTPDDIVTATTAWKLYSADATAATSARLFTNGTLLRSGGTTSTYGFNQNVNICGHDDISTEDADCDVAEVVMYNRKLSDAERQQVESYLRVKWGF